MAPHVALHEAEGRSPPMPLISIETSIGYELPA